MAKKVEVPDMEKFFNRKLTGYSCGYGLIDRVSGVPGILFPNGVAVELYGQKSSGKTTLVLETIAYNQIINPDFRVLYMDYEKMLRQEIPYLNSLGIQATADKINIQEPETAEDGMNYMINALRNDDYDMMVVDTVAAMCPRAELENKMGDSKQMGLRAKLMNEFLRKFFAVCGPDGPALIFLNQQYKDMNSMSYVQTYHTPSSDGLGYYAGIKIQVKEKSKLKRDIVDPYTFEKIPQPYGSVIEIKTDKNKVGRPFISTKYFISYGKGIDIIPSLVNAAIAKKVIRYKGNSKAVHLFEDADGNEKQVNGYAKVLDYFAENLDDLVHVGSQINELWAADMVHLKERLSAKHPLQDSMFEDMYSDNDVDLDLQSGIQDGLKSIMADSGDRELPETVASVSFDGDSDLLDPAGGSDGDGLKLL